MNKVQKVLAAVGTAAVLATGATACNTGGGGYSDQGYEQVWYNGSYQYVPYSYYQSHRSLYNNHLHPAHHASSSYVTSHHVHVTHQTTTTTHSNGRTTTRRTTTTTHHTTTRRSSGFGRSTRRR